MSVKFHEAYALDSQQDQLLWWDDFLGDQVQDEWRITAAGGSGVVVDQQTGGIVRLTTGNVSGNNAIIDWADIRTLHVGQRVSIEFRLKLAQTGSINCLIGLYKDGSNMINFVESGNWLIRCEDGGVRTQPSSGVAVDTDWHVFRIECHTHGASHVHFYIDGTECNNSPVNTNVPDDANDFLQPQFNLQTAEDVAKSMDVDYCVVRQDV